MTGVLSRIEETIGRRRVGGSHGGVSGKFMNRSGDPPVHKPSRKGFRRCRVNINGQKNGLYC